MDTKLLIIDWTVMLGYFLWLLIFTICIYLGYQGLIKLRNFIEYFDKKEKVEITGLITEMVDDPFPMINPHGHIDNCPIYLDEKGQPIVGHNFWMMVESNKVFKLINLNKKLFDDINENFKAGARFIKINCSKLVRNERLDGEEIVCF